MSLGAMVCNVPVEGGADARALRQGCASPHGWPVDMSVSLPLERALNCLAHRLASIEQSLVRERRKVPSETFEVPMGPCGDWSTPIGSQEAHILECPADPHAVRYIVEGLVM